MKSLVLAMRGKVATELPHAKRWVEKQDYLQAVKTLEDR